MARTEQGQPARTESIIAELTHPIYLDTPMLVSFLATLDDGVSFSSEVAETVADKRKASGEGSGDARLPGLASLLGLSLSASGKYAREKAEDQSTESKFVRQHTAASLFNRLRLGLKQQNVLKTVNAGAGVSSLSPGALVEVAGTIEASPLETLVKTFNDMLPFIERGSGGQQPLQVNRARRRSMTPEELAELELLEQQQATARQEQQGLEDTKRIVALIEQDFQASPVVDLVLRRNDLSVIITASRDFFSEDVNAALLGGTFTLVGKVTAVAAAADAQTMVVRRGAMGLIANAAITPMLQQARQVFALQGLTLDLPDAQITGPYLQVIPLAVYI